MGKVAAVAAVVAVVAWLLCAATADARSYRLPMSVAKREAARHARVVVPQLPATGYALACRRTSRRRVICTVSYFDVLFADGMRRTVDEVVRMQQGRRLRVDFGLFDESAEEGEAFFDSDLDVVARVGRHARWVFPADRHETPRGER